METMTHNQSPITYNAVREELDKAVNGLNNTYNALTEEIDEFRRSRDQLRRVYNALQAQCRQQSEDFDNLNSSYDALRYEHNTLKIAYDSLDDNYKHLQAKYERLQRGSNVMQHLNAKAKKVADHKTEAPHNWSVDIKYNNPSTTSWAQESRTCCRAEEDAGVCCKPEMTNPETYHKCKCSSEDRIVAGCSRGVMYEHEAPMPLPSDRAMLVDTSKH